MSFSRSRFIPGKLPRRGLGGRGKRRRRGRGMPLLAIRLILIYLCRKTRFSGSWEALRLLCPKSPETSFATCTIFSSLLPPSLLFPSPLPPHLSPPLLLFSSYFRKFYPPSSFLICSGVFGRPFPSLTALLVPSSCSDSVPSCSFLCPVLFLFFSSHSLPLSLALPSPLFPVYLLLPPLLYVTSPYREFF